MFFSFNIYSTDTENDLEHVGYMFAFNSTIEGAVHVVVAEINGLIGAAETLTRFDGYNQVYDSNVLTNVQDASSVHDVIVKRDIA